MKKLIFLMASIIISVTACKKDDETKPVIIPMIIPNDTVYPTYTPTVQVVDSLIFNDSTYFLMWLKKTEPANSFSKNEFNFAMPINIADSIFIAKIYLQFGKSCRIDYTNLTIDELGINEKINMDGDTPISSGPALGSSGVFKTIDISNLKINKTDSLHFTLTVYPLNYSITPRDSAWMELKFNIDGIGCIK